MVVGYGADRAPTINDVPRLVAQVALTQPERVAVRLGDVQTSFGTLHDALTRLDTAMGGALGPDTLLSLVLSELSPVVFESDAGALDRAVVAVIKAAEVVDIDSMMGDGGEHLLLDAFERYVDRDPERVALEFDGLEVTYAELDRRSNRVARYLRAQGVGPDRTVALALRRSIDLVVGMYGIVKAGGAYVPLDPDHPADRSAYVIEVSRPVLALTDDRLDYRFPRTVPHADVGAIVASDIDDSALRPDERVSETRPDDLAYVIFTSGSTGRPKGVAVSHAAICANLAWRQRHYGMTERDVVLQKTPFTFDVSVWEFFWPLQVGARLVLAEPDGHGDPEYLTGLIRRASVTIVHFVPSMLAVFVDAPGTRDLPSLRYVFASGEELTSPLAARFAAVSGAELHNLYGPTEAAVDVTHHQVLDPDAQFVPIGTAVDDTELRVLDSGLELVPPGSVGELYITGIQLARGYLSRTDTTAERFVADPFAVGSRMYRTGDLVKQTDDGSLIYLGRTDFQIKLHGLRIELGEIESVLAENDSVSQSVVILRRDRLVGYVVESRGHTVQPEELLAKLRRTLPAYMVPSSLLVLHSMPLGRSGKLDRRALPDPPADRREFHAPLSGTEVAVADSFSEVLGVDPVGRDDDFFDLGGNSLTATRIVARMNAHFGVRTAVRDFFDAPSVAQWAAVLDSAASDAGSPRPSIGAVAWPEQIPLAPAQQRMWFLNRLDPDSAIDNISLVIRLLGQLNIEALRAAVDDVVVRHASLRTRYPEIGGAGTQDVVSAEDMDIDWIATHADETGLLERIVAEVGLPFDVVAAPPFRVRLLTVHDEEHVLVVVVHHIAADGFSMVPLTSDVMIAYAARASGRAPDRTPLAVQYVDYTLWQRAVLGKVDDPTSLIRAQEGYWAKNLAGLPEDLSLPSDRSRPSRWSGRGLTHRLSLPPEIHRGIVDLARGRASTTFMVVHAALAVLLARVSGSSDIAVGTPVAGRGEAVLDDLVGMFVNTLVLRTQISGGSSFDEVLAGVRAVDLAAFAHADVPFERVVEVVDPPRVQGRHPLIQTMLTFRDVGTTHLELDGLTVDAVDIDVAMAKFDLDFTVSEQFSALGDPQGVSIEITYATDLFDASTIESIARRLTAVLSAVVDDSSVGVGDIDLLSAAEAAGLNAINDTEHDVDPSATLVTMFEAQAKATPNAVALVYEDESLTYREFERRVDLLAQYLNSMGVGPEVCIAVVMRRSFDLLVAIYAVVKAGGAYVPVDPEQPADRVRYILVTSGVALALSTSRDNFESDSCPVVEIDDPSFLTSPRPDREPVASPGARNTAYILFTSGSTGTPKGVSVDHRAIVNRLVWMQAQYPLTPADVVIQKTPVTFDVSIWELFWPLQIGARLVIARPDGHRDPEYLAELMGAERVTVAHFVPSMAAVFASERGSRRADALRWIFASGEALPSSTARALRNVLPAAGVVNLYGPTEAAVDVTFHEFSDSDGAGVPIGVPVFNTRVHVLDGRLHPIMPGAIGELYLGGVQLARGYVCRPDLTSDRFVADPFSDPGHRLYRTGDLVRWTSAGELEYIGRTDFQVKLRGLRIELGEVEDVIRHDHSVSQAVVAVRKDRLVAYVVPTLGAQVDADLVRASAALLLPEYMVPSTFFVLDEFPLGPSGKLDRKALPDPVFEKRAFREPRTETERTIARVFGDVLGVDRVGLDDDFFALGGNSLVATRVVSRIGVLLDAHVPVRSLFDASVVVELAALVAASEGTGGRIPLVAGRRPAYVPLSLAQQRMWFLDRFDPDSAAYNIPVVVRLGGGIDVDALGRAIDDVRSRHESLRTVYPEHDGIGYQVVLPIPSSPFELGVTHCSETDAFRAIRELVVKRFMLQSAAPLRAHLYRVSDSEDILAVVVHHIAADGFSVGPLMRDIVSAYEARTSGSEPTWLPLPIQYADYAVWQREMLGDEADPHSLVSRQIRFWTRELDGMPEHLDLPADRPRPTVATERGAVHSFGVSDSLHRAMVSLGLELGCTPFMIVHAAFAVLLARLSSSDDIAIGTPVAGRGDSQLDDVIGMFVNTLVLRTRVSDSATVADLLARVRAVDLDAFGNADIPFERLVEVLDPPRSTARQPLFQVMLAFQNLGRSAVELPGISAAGVELETGLSKFDMYLTMSEEFDHSGEPLGMSAQLLYLTDLFDNSTIAATGERFVRILEGMVADTSAVVGDIDILTEHENRSVVQTWNRTDVAPTNELLLDRYRQWVTRTPDAVAITFEDTSITYGEFDSRVAVLARYLTAQGIGPDCAVGIAMARSTDLIVGIYAIVSAGAAYVPVDPAQPVERVHRMLESAGVSILLSASRDRFADDRFFVVEIDLPLPVKSPRHDESTSILRPDHAAYVLFTSGSTGRPKGVVVSHRAIVNRLNWMQSEYALDAEDVVVQKTPVTFDVSVWELFWPLQVGAKIVIARPDGHRDPVYLARLLETQSVTVAHFVPSMLAVFSAEERAADIETLRCVFVSGEALAATTARELATVLPRVRIINLYGPTEASVDVTYHEFKDTDTVSVPIGRPVDATRVYVLDARLHPVAPNVVGELYLAGVQLARGYASRPGSTAERFVADPFNEAGDRLYRTGDLVRWTRAGELDYVGRRDFQVKLRGQRIESGEVEAALVSHPGVLQAVVVLRSDSTVGDVLVGYVVPEAGSTVDPARVRATAAGLVPDYMVPTSVIVVDVFPVGPNGKLDRRALPEPVFRTKVFRPSSTPIEELISEIYRDLLGVDRVGLDDDFFALGGNSLTATRVVSRLGSALGTDVPLKLLFEAPGVEMLAGRVEHESGSIRRAAVTARADHGAPIPLSLAQQRMWFLNRLDPYSAANNIPVTIRLTGELNVDAFADAFLDVTARHDILRTVYPDVDGIGRQVIEPAARGSVVLQIEEIDPARTAERALSMVAEGFDVTEAVPVRAALLVESPVAHVLVVVAHHIAIDGFSIGPLTRDLVRAYAARMIGQDPGWERPAVQYADYAVWQRDSLGTESDPTSLASTQIGYWTSQLADLPAEIELPTDRPRTAEGSTRAAAVTVAVDAALRARVAAFAYSVGATPFMVMHAALAVLLARLSASHDVAVGTPVAGRGERELDDMIGMFVNTLVLRSTVDSAANFSAIVQDVRETDLSAFAHSDVPFEQIVDAVDPPRVRGRHPLFQVMFTFQNLAQTHLELPNLTISGMEFDAVQAKFDLQITVSDAYEDEGVGGWNVEFAYTTDLFDRGTVDGFASGYRSLLSGLLGNPQRAVGDIESMPRAERDRLLQVWSSSGPDVAAEVGTEEHVATLADRFAAAAGAYPDRVALRFDDISLTYRDLSSRVNVLARELISIGAGPEALIAVAMPRSAELVVALLAVSVSGAAYLPVDPSYPRDRIDFMISDASPVAVLTSDTSENFGGVPVIDLATFDTKARTASAVTNSEVTNAAVTNADRRTPLTAANLAYVIYTSGSTGVPKGVAVTHRNVIRLFENTASAFRFDSTDVWTMFHSYAFDFSVWEMWGPLLHGGSLVVVDYHTSRSPEAFRELLAVEGVTVLNQTPSAFHQLVEVDRVLPSVSLTLRLVMFGGEALQPRRLLNWFERHGDGEPGTSGPALVNLYGITETTVHVSIRPLSARDASSASVLGVPIPGLRVYVLDRRLHPVPIGVSGEIYVAGGQLARGYVGRPGLSATRFVADPYRADGSMLYRTGDRARWIQTDGAGELEYLGRADDQVKVRGFRIELGEVEAAVSAQPSVSSVAVVVRHVPPGGDTLVAYVVLVDGPSVDVEELRRGVAEWIPEHMVPSAFVPVDRIPLTVNGKLDGAALPAPTFIVSEFRAPSNPVEEVVAGVFAEVLGVERVGADDEFFALGGNSLVATRVASRLGAALDTTVTVRALFEASTVAELAARLETDIGAGKGGRRELVARTRPDPIPLAYAQQRMWFLNRLDPTSAAYNISFALRLNGSVDKNALALAFGDVIGRHETLRTRYPDFSGVGSQEVVPIADVEVDLTEEQVTEEELVERVRAVLETSFDVTTAVPLLVRVFRLSDNEHVVVFVVHHIAADGFSLGALTRDLMTAYASRSQGRPPGWRPLQVQYADYVLWHRETLGDERDSTSILAVQQGFWRRELDGLGEQSGIPTDRPRAAVSSGMGATHVLEISAELLDSLDTGARELNSTVFMLLHTAVAILLAQLSGDEDVAVGTPVAGRGESQLDGVVGMFVNTLVLRTFVSSASTVADVLRTVRETDLDAFAHSDVPFDRIVELLDPPRSGARSPFFQVVVALQNFGTTWLDLPGLSITGLETVDHVANYDLQFVFSERRSGDSESALGCAIVYATDLYDRATIESVAEHLVTVLQIVALEPKTVVGEIDLATTPEESIVEAQATLRARPHVRTVPQLFDASVDAEPDAPFVVENGTESTYLDVSGRAARLARYLVSEGVGPGLRVAVELPPGLERIVALWAVWSAGAAVALGSGRAASLVDVVLTTEGSVLDGSGDGIRVIVSDAADVVAAVASQSSRPVDYASRTGALVPEDEALVVFEDGNPIALSHGDTSALAAEFVRTWEVTYESRLTVVRGRRSTTDDAWAAFGVLVASAEGAAIVVDTGEGDVESLIEQEWVSHVVGESSFVRGVLDFDGVLVVSTDGSSVPWVTHFG